MNLLCMSLAAPEWVSSAIFFNLNMDAILIMRGVRAHMLGTCSKFEYCGAAMWNLQVPRPQTIGPFPKMFKDKTLRCVFLKATCRRIRVTQRNA